MSTYTASVRVDGDMLTVARPLTAPDPVGDMIDSLVYDMTKDGGAATSGVTSVELTVETSAESDTPVGDSIAATSQQQLNPAGPDDPMLPDDTAVAPAVQA